MRGVTFDPVAASARLRDATPRAILSHAVEQFGQGLLFTSSFGAQSGVLLHLWSEVARPLPVVFLDTGFLFPETLAYRDALASRLGLTVKTLVPDIPNADFVARYGTDIQERDADFCCGVNKVAPLAPLRDAATAWVSGLRRDQSGQRQSLRQSRQQFLRLRFGQVFDQLRQIVLHQRQHQKSVLRQQCGVRITGIARLQPHLVAPRGEIIEPGADLAAIRMKQNRRFADDQQARAFMPRGQPMVRAASARILRLRER